MYLPVPGFEPTSSEFLDKCVSYSLGHREKCINFEKDQDHRLNTKKKKKKKKILKFLAVPFSVIYRCLCQYMWNITLTVGVEIKRSILMKL